MEKIVTYKNLSVSASSLAFCLFIALLLFPGLIYWLFGIEGAASTDFMSKRAAMLFLGLSIIAFTSRDAPPSAARQSICLGIGVIMLTLALLGIFEFIRGNAAIGIWLAIAIEVPFAIGFFKIWQRSA